MPMRRSRRMRPGWHLEFSWLQVEKVCSEEFGWARRVTQARHLFILAECGFHDRQAAVSIDPVGHKG